jgi:DNA-binding response OmpR family regulator
MSTSTARIMLYSDDRTVREQVRLALGSKLAGRELEFFEVATHPAAITAMDATQAPGAEGFDLLILDGEAVPYGGMGLCHQFKTEFDPCPPVLALVARVADAWLASWSMADAIASYPLDPMALPTEAAKLLSLEEVASA